MYDGGDASDAGAVMARRQAFILRHTRRQRVPLLPELQLYLADEITPLWRMTARELGVPDPPPPFWAFAWAGGQAVARYVLDHPAEVAGQQVLDLASGSGLCAIAAVTAGAARILAADIDPFSAAAVALNAGANEVPVAFTGRDLLQDDPPAADVILAGDVWYEQPLAARVARWLHVAQRRGSRILTGDPGRPYVPRERLIRLATYDVPASRELEDREVKPAQVYTLLDINDDGRG